MQILLILVIIFITISAVIIFSAGQKASNDRKKKDLSGISAKDRETLIREANRQLELNPKDPVALESLANVYYEKGEYKKAMHMYRLLISQMSSSSHLNEGQLNMRYGLSAMHIESWTEAYKGLMIAHTKNPGVIDVNANLGKLEFMRRQYNQAVSLLEPVLKVQSDHVETLKYLGRSLFHLKRYSHAIPHLKLSVAARPDDKESLYALARCQYEMSQLEKAQKVFRYLRTDPKFGPNATLYSGTIFARKREWEEAIIDYQMGLNHENVSQELQLELKYRQAEAFSQTQRIDRALALLNEIYEVSPDFKDVSVRIQRYRELNSNENLQIYLFASYEEFTALCRQLIRTVFPKAEITINHVSSQHAEYIDFLAEIKTEQWEDIVIFRFMRVEGQVGELFIHDLYAHSRELHAGRGCCFTVGTFTKEAVRFVEARLIDLIDKPALMTLLKSIDSSSLATLN